MVSQKSAHYSASTYHFGRYAELVELLLVVCPRLGAVVGNKYELLALPLSVGIVVRPLGLALPLLLSISSVSGTFS
jgi:hypothetical protein